MIRFELLYFGHVASNYMVATGADVINLRSSERGSPTTDDPRVTRALNWAAGVGAALAVPLLMMVGGKLSSMSDRQVVMDARIEAIMSSGSKQDLRISTLERQVTDLRVTLAAMKQ